MASCLLRLLRHQHQRNLKTIESAIMKALQKLEGFLLKVLFDYCMGV
jgi:hypothetical protein